MPISQQLINDEFIKIIHHHNRIKDYDAQGYWSKHYIDTHERHGIPNRGHSIWLGSEFPPPIFVYLRESTWENNIKSLKKYNPDYNHVLWMDKTDFEKLPLDKQQLTKKLCFDSHISLVCFQDVFNTPDEIEKRLFEIYRRKHMEGNYGGASDVLRIMILRRFYGLYYDTDDRILKNFIDNLFSKARVQNYGCGNDIISVPMSKQKGDSVDLEFDKLCSQLIGNHKKKFSELFDRPMASGSRAYPAINYSQNYLTIPYFYIRRSHTIIGTGPNVIVQNDLSSKLPSEYFFSMSAETWLGTTGKSKNWSYVDENNKISSLPKWNEFVLPPQDSVNNLLNLLSDMISYYHSLESRTIRFDFYKRDIMKTYFDTGINLEHLMFQKFIQNSSMQLSQVEYIPFNLFDFFTKNYTVLFDKKIFPNLKSEMYLPEIRHLIQTNDQAKEFFNQAEYREIYEKAQLLEQTLESDAELKRNICNKVPYLSQLNDLLKEIFKENFNLEKLANFNLLFSKDILLAKSLDTLRGETGKNNVLMLDSLITTDVLKQENAVLVIKGLAKSQIFLRASSFKETRDYNLQAIEFFVSNNITSINEDPEIKAYIQNSCLIDEQVLVSAIKNGHYHLVELLLDQSVKPVLSSIYLDTTELAQIIANPKLPSAIKKYLIDTMSTDFEWQDLILKSGNQELIKILYEHQVKFDESMVLASPSSQLEEKKKLFSHSLMNALAASTESEVRTYLRERMGNIYLFSLFNNDAPEVELANYLKDIKHFFNKPISAYTFSLYLIHQAYMNNSQIFTLEACKKLYESYLNSLNDYLIESGRSLNVETTYNTDDELTTIFQTLADTKVISSQFDLQSIEHERLLHPANLSKMVLSNLKDYMFDSQSSKSDITDIKPGNILFFSELKANNINPGIAADYYQQLMDFVEGDVEKKIIIYTLFLNQNMQQISQKISNKLGFNSLSEAIEVMHETIISDYNAILALNNVDSQLSAAQLKEKSDEFETVLHEKFIKPVIASINEGKNPMVDSEYTNNYMHSFGLLDELISLTYQSESYPDASSITPPNNN